MNVVDHLTELYKLAGAQCDGVLTPPQAARLEELVLADAELRRRYILYMQIHAQAERGGARASGLGSWDPVGAAVEGGKGDRSNLCEAPSGPFRQIGPVPFSAPEPPDPPIIIRTSSALPAPSGFLPLTVGGWPFSYAAATLIMGAAILGAWAYKVSHDYSSVEPSGRSTAVVHVDKQPDLVGRITGMADCRWTDPDDASPGAAVPLGRKYALAAGLMEISYQSGAKVILQGPCTYEVESASGGFLSVGRLTAKVERSEVRGQGSEIRNQKSEISNPQSPILNPLFVVHTPTATVTDLGTEFGVEVSKEGTTTSHVFRGSVHVRTAAGVGGQAEIILRQDEWTRVEKADGANAPRLARHTTAGISASFRRWLVEPPKVLDLLDIVAGGDGRGRRRERGIDPTTGMEDPVFLPEPRTGRRGYHGAGWWNRLVDGVFVPDGSRGPAVLDSAGHTFAGFPPTAGKSFGPIWARAAEVKSDQRAKDARYWVYWMGNGGRYMPDNRGLLALHANAGVTFDLEAIRRKHPGVRPARFRAVAGVADGTNVLDAWVFVDGRVKCKCAGFRHIDGALRVEADLGPHDRFLTLASACSGDLEYAWFLLGDPVLEMVSGEEGQR